MDDDDLDARMAGVEFPPEACFDHPIQSAKARLFHKPQPKRRIAGRFCLGRVLGSGGMGTVYEAHDEKLKRPVAIKLVGAPLQSAHEERLRREAHALAQLSHPNVVGIYDADTVNGDTFIAMELLGGETLADWQRARRTWQECVGVYLQAGRGLAAAHAAKLVHRDFKPANCIIDTKGHVRVLDFGLAGMPIDDEGAATSASNASVAKDTDPGARSSDSIPLSRTAPDRLTKAGAILGTRAYMAPEQLHPRTADARSDQFSFCVAFYEALYGALPFGDDPGRILLEMAHGAAHIPLPPPSARKVPRWLRRIVLRGLSARPDARWPSMAELLGEIERQRRRAKQWSVGFAIGGPICVALASVLSSVYSTSLACTEARDGLDDIWDSAREERVGQAFLAARHPGAPHAWATVRRELGHYADDWTLASTQACEATRVHHEQSVEVLERRRRCLSRARSALRERVDLLASGDPDVVNEAVALVTTLPRIEPCGDVALLARDAGELSPEAEIRSSDLQEALERIRAQDLIGWHREAQQEIGPLVEQASMLAHPPVLAEALQLSGQIHVNVGDHDTAEKLFREARRSAPAHEHSVRAAAGLVHIIGIERAKPETALELGRNAEELARSPGLEPSLRAEVLTTVAQVQTQRGEHFEARTLYAIAIELLEARFGRSHIALVEALDGQGTAADKQGQREAAERSYRRALKIREHWLGPDHPAVAYQLANLAAVLVDDGSRGVETLELCTRAARILEQATTSNHKRLAHVHVNLGSVLSKLDRQPGAVTHLRLAIDEWGKAGQASHPRTAMAYFNLGRVLQKQGRDQEAIEAYRRVQQILESNEPTPELDALKAKARARAERLQGARGVDSTPSAIAQ